MSDDFSVSDAPPPYGTVVFDCDSTLSAIEGICELAGADHIEELARLTDQAMDGTTPLEEVFGRRLELVRPSRERVAEIGERYVANLLPGVPELVRALRHLGKRLAIVSGGLLPAVARVGQHLGIDEVYAVDVCFGPDGAYADFDRSSPLARTGGKPHVVRGIASAPEAGPVVLVGDGVTDLEAAPFLARFVAFGGVERREAVFRAALITWDRPDFRGLAPLLISPGEIETLRSHAEHAELFA